MATRYTVPAEQAVAPAFNEAQAGIDAQLPAVAQLYNSLVGALQAGAQTGTQTVVDSANRRGVGRANLAGDVAGTLDEAVQLGTAQVGRQRAGAEANIADVGATLGSSRVDSITKMAQALQEGDLALQKEALQQQMDREEASLKMTNLDRENDLAIKTANAKAAAAARAKKAEGPDKNIYEAYLLRKAGADGNVSPATFKEAMQDWVDNGGSPAAFVSTYGGFINKQHTKDYFSTDASKIQRMQSAMMSGVTNPLKLARK